MGREVILYTSASGEGQTKRSRERKATLENDIVRRRKRKNSQIPKELNTMRGKAKRVGARERELEWKGLNKRV